MNYERLEFLGDAILESVVVEHLVVNYAEKEGILAGWKDTLVSNKLLAVVSDELELPAFLEVGEDTPGDTEEKIAKRPADIVEALIGAIYRDQGEDAAKSFVETYVLKHLPEIIAADPQIQFRELAMEQWGVRPSELVEDAEGPNGEHWYSVSVFIGDELYISAVGSQLRYAHKDAARAALAKANGVELEVAETPVDPDEDPEEILEPTSQVQPQTAPVPTASSGLIRTAVFMGGSRAFQELPEAQQTAIMMELVEKDLDPPK